MACAFSYPKCSVNLDDYMLSRKIIMGFGNTVMKHDLLRRFNRLGDMQDVLLVDTCLMYECGENSGMAKRGVTQLQTIGSHVPTPTHTCSWCLMF